VASSFYDGDPARGGTLIAVAHSTNMLASGQFADLSVNWGRAAIAVHEVYVAADDLGNGTGRLTESNETNNRSMPTWT